jgi:RNA polymerase sigma-70 factor (ECF subfamily)
MRVWQHVAAGKDITHERAWLYRAAHNAFVNEIRNKKTIQSFDVIVEDTSFDVPDESANTSASADHRELLSYLNQLKESYRQVLIMRYIDDLSVVEIAGILDEHETNVSMRIKRALDKLRTLYESVSAHSL